MMWRLGEPEHKHFGFLVCSLEYCFFQYNQIISTSKLPFHNPLLMKYYTAFGIFFFRLWKLFFHLIHLVDYFAHKLYLSNTHKLHESWLGVLYAWMNGYSTLLHNIAPGKYIVIKVEYGLQLCFKTFLKKSDRKKKTTKIIIKMLMVLDFKILSLWFLIKYWRYKTLTCENNWFLLVLVKSNFAPPTPFGSVSCFVVGVDLSNYNLNSVLIHKVSYSKEYQSYLMHKADTLSTCQRSFVSFYLLNNVLCVLYVYCCIRVYVYRGPQCRLAIKLNVFTLLK